MHQKAKSWRITCDKFLTLDQVEQLLAAMLTRRDLAIARGNDIQGIRDFYLIMGLLETGLRVFEFCALKDSDLSGLRLSVRRGKGDKPRTVLLTRGTAKLLRQWQLLKDSLGYSTEPESPLFPSRYNRLYSTRGVQKRVKAVFQSLGFSRNLSAHSLRHTYCSLLLASGKVSLATVKENLGHHSIAVTNLYAHAVGDLSEIDLYPARSSEKAELSEPGATRLKKNPSNIVESYLRNANLNRGGGRK